jgi:redox-sensing transcriptional repressor
MNSQHDSIQRLSHYKSVLYKLKSMGFVKVFSDNLADAIGVSSALVRKDFSAFGLTGNKRGGYRIDDLIGQLQGILGKDEVHAVIVIGCGKIGSALLNYRGFASERIKVIAGFDVDPAKINVSAPVPIHDIQDLGKVIKGQRVQVAITTVPETAASFVIDTLRQHGIRGILNFAPGTLKGDGQCIIHNINLAMEIENLLYRVRLAERESHPGSRAAGGRSRS